MTAEYTFVDMERQQLTRVNQDRLENAGQNKPSDAKKIPTPDIPPTATPATSAKPPLQQMPTASRLIQ